MAVKTLRDMMRNRTPGYDGNPPDIEVKRLARDLVINLNAAPLENLVGTRRMECGLDAPDRGLIRTSVATRFRDTMAGAQVTLLKTADLEASGGGSGRSVSDFKIDCMGTLNHLQAKMPPPAYDLLTRVCYQDQWVWRGLSRKREMEMIYRVHKALDMAALVFGMLTEDEVLARWRTPRSSKGKARRKAATQSNPSGR